MIFEGWDFVVDRDATRAAYKAAERGGSQECECAGCRNFCDARSVVFSSKFLAFLDELGIDPRKDAEVVHIQRVAPGMHHYSGWFHFVGTLNKSADTVTNFGDGFSVWMCPSFAPRLASLRGKEVVQLEFETPNVPWLIDAEEPT